MGAKKEQFISLKEAAKISGYSPDHLGYLIRKKRYH
jgi:predicted HTH domain antitoxin